MSVCLSGAKEQMKNSTAQNKRDKIIDKQEKEHQTGGYAVLGWRSSLPILILARTLPEVPAGTHRPFFSCLFSFFFFLHTQAVTQEENADWMDTVEQPGDTTGGRPLAASSRRPAVHTNPSPGLPQRILKRSGPLLPSGQTRGNSHSMH